MANLLAGVIGALLGVAGVAFGAWLQGRREHQRWLRDQKLHAAVDFVGGTGDLYLLKRRAGTERAAEIDERAARARTQDGRSALYLLCDTATVKVAEKLMKQLRKVEPVTDDSDDDDAIGLLRELVRLLRGELGTGASPHDVSAIATAPVANEGGSTRTEPDETPR